MKTSTIKIALRQQLNNWIETIHDETVRKLVQKNAFVTGGAITSMLQGEMPNDIDVYFRTRETALAVAMYYVKDFNSRADNRYRIMQEAWNAHAAWQKQNKDYHCRQGRDYIDTSKWPPTPVKPMHETLVKTENRRNCKGELEDRIIIYAKSAGVVSETQSKYEYFEQREEHEADDFMNSLKTDSDSQAEHAYEEMSEAPLKYAEDLASDLRRPAGRPPTGIEGKYRPVFLSENAITLSHKIQLVVRFYGEPAEIHQNYDYAHCMCWYKLDGDELVLPQEALECILSKTLIYKGSLYPLASIFRLRKFIARGWRITAGQLLKIMWQISEIDLKNKEILRDQLIGVDQAYMHQLLRALETKDGKIDATYLTKLVDEIFE